MRYYVKMMGHRGLHTAEGDTDAEAILQCLKDSAVLRTANPSQVVVCVYHRYADHDHLSYVSTLAKYQAEAER
jgi:hypothetical protein